MNRFSWNLSTVFLLVLGGVASGIDSNLNPQAAATKLTYDSTNTFKEGDGVNIYKGNTTTMNTHRYLVVIKKEGEFHCAGGIVSVNWVLTTGDCTADSTPKQLTVITGSTDGKTGKKFAVSKIVQHPEYGKSTMDYEYSCVQVVGKFYYWAKRSHLLPLSAPQDYMTFTAAGYGYTDSSSTTRELRKAVMTWLPKSYCETVYKGFDFSWSDRMACAYSPDTATLCDGDYGDSFVVGQVVYGQFLGGATVGFCTDNAKPVIISNIFDQADWIHNITGARWASKNIQLTMN